MTVVHLSISFQPFCKSLLTLACPGVECISCSIITHDEKQASSTGYLATKIWEALSAMLHCSSQQHQNHLLSVFAWGVLTGHIVNIPISDSWPSETKPAQGVGQHISKRSTVSKWQIVSKRQTLSKRLSWQATVY